jgi:hypothetical protein
MSMRINRTKTAPVALARNSKRSGAIVSILGEDYHCYGYIEDAIEQARIINVQTKGMTRRQISARYGLSQR